MSTENESPLQENTRNEFSYEDIFEDRSLLELSVSADKLKGLLKESIFVTGTDAKFEIDVPSEKLALFIEILSTFDIHPWTELSPDNSERSRVSVEHRKDVAKLAYFNLIPDQTEDTTTTQELAQPTEVIQEEPDNVTFLREVFSTTQLQTKNDTITSILIPELPSETKTKLGDILYELEIYPGLSETAAGPTLAIYNSSDIDKLISLGVFSAPTEVEETTNEPDFVLPSKTSQSPKPATPQTRRVKPESFSPISEDESVDDFFEKTTARFYGGLPIDYEKDAAGKNYSYPNHSVLTKSYNWKEGELYTLEDEHIPKERFMEILAAAKEDPAMLDQAVKMNLGFVFYVFNNLKQYYVPNHRVEADDIIQNGMEGLLYAIKKHDPDSHDGYQSYFLKCIEGYMRRGLRERKVLRTPHHLAPLERKVMRAQRILFAESNTLSGEDLDKGKIQLIAEKAEMPYHDTRKILWELGLIAIPYDEEDELEYAEVSDISLGNDSDIPQGVIQENIRDKVSEALNSLPANEDLGLRLKYGIVDNSERWKVANPSELFELPTVRDKFKTMFERLEAKDFANILTIKDLTRAEKIVLCITGRLPEEMATELRDAVYKETDFASTLEEAGDIFSVTRERFRQIEAKALRHMKHPSRSRKVRSLLDD